MQVSEKNSVTVTLAAGSPSAALASALVACRVRPMLCGPAAAPQWGPGSRRGGGKAAPAEIASAPTATTPPASDSWYGGVSVMATSIAWGL